MRRCEASARRLLRKYRLESRAPLCRAGAVPHLASALLRAAVPPPAGAATSAGSPPSRVAEARRAAARALYSLACAPEGRAALRQLPAPLRRGMAEVAWVASPADGSGAADVRRELGQTMLVTWPPPAPRARDSDTRYRDCTSLRSDTRCCHPSLLASIQAPPSNRPEPRLPTTSPPPTERSTNIPPQPYARCSSRRDSDDAIHRLSSRSTTPSPLRLPLWLAEL